MLPITQISDPSFEVCGIIFADLVTVGRDGGFAGDGGPGAGGVEEGDVDLVVFGQVVGFAGFGVGVEEGVDSSAFLFVMGGLSVIVVRIWGM